MVFDTAKKGPSKGSMKNRSYIDALNGLDGEYIFQVLRPDAQRCQRAHLEVIWVWR